MVERPVAPGRDRDPRPRGPGRHGLVFAADTIVAVLRRFQAAKRLPAKRLVAAVIIAMMLAIGVLSEDRQLLQSSFSCLDSDPAVREVIEEFDIT